jgi:high affinity Mn2+ porin
MATLFRIVVTTSVLALAVPTFAAEDSSRFAWHLQATYVEQQVGHFQSPFSGSNSLTPNQSQQTADVTLYAGARLWPGAELWVNPELDQGFGLNDTTGLAGFSSGEAYKVGRTTPYLRWQRAFVRQTWNLGGERSGVEAAPNRSASC